ncbi:PHB depolymerase family esterase [Mesorhizobium sp. B2-1-8]|nr:PHB depolymerase family esterase [Mesorhizobium sp. B2-1-8]
MADRRGFAVLFPEQQRSDNANLCFNWFIPDDTRRGSGEALSIRQMIEAVMVAQDSDRTRIFVTGLSAGGAMPAAMLATYPEVFAGGAILAGLPYGSATTLPQAFDRMSWRPNGEAIWLRQSSKQPVTPDHGRSSLSGMEAPTRRSAPSIPINSSGSGLHFMDKVKLKPTPRSARPIAATFGRLLRMRSRRILPHLRHGARNSCGLGRRLE